MPSIKTFTKVDKKSKPLALVTAYDATLAALAEAAKVDAILVGDSLGMVVQGMPDTLSVTLDEMIYHTRIVTRGAPETFVIVDLPFMSYQGSPNLALESSGRCLKEGRAQAVKMEGGLNLVPHIKAVVGAGIPVMGHIGLQPQSINQYGGYSKRGKSSLQAKKLLEDASALSDAGVFSMVVENIPADLAREITTSVAVPVIGIGAGPHCDGQIQVFHDLIGLQPSFKPRHTQRYMNAGTDIIRAMSQYVNDVRKGDFISK